MTMLSLVIILFALVAFFIVIGVGVLIGVLVYKDATKKEMNYPILWALLAVFAPSFIGLLIYLIVRNNYPKNNETYYNQANTHSNTSKQMTCHFCGCKIQSNDVICPHCGVTLKTESSEVEK